MGWGLGIERVLDLLKQEGIEPPVRAWDAYVVIPDAAALPLATATAEALRAAGVSVLLHAAGKDGPGSMKSQFKKADASGARHALIFGADELARGEVSIKPLRDAARHSARGRWRCRRLGARTAQRIIRAFQLAPDPVRRTHGHTLRPAGAGTARRPQGLLEAVRQPHHLGSDRRVVGVCRPECLEMVAARAVGEGRCVVRTTADRRSGPATRSVPGRSSAI